MRSLASTCALLAALALAPTAARALDRELHASSPIGTASAVRLVLPVGEIEVRGDGGRTVTAELVVECRRRARCADRAEDVHIDTTRRGDTLVLAVVGYPRLLKSDNMSVTGVVHVPGDLPLDVAMSVGELRLEDVSADLHVDLGVGEVHANLPADQVRRVRLASSLGDATLRAPEGRYEARRSFLLGAKLRWDEGQGSSVVDVGVGVGEVDVRLD